MDKLDAICGKCGHRARRHSVIGKHECFDCDCQWYKVAEEDPFVTPVVVDKEEVPEVYVSPTNEWMQTYTGRAFFPFDLDRSEIDIRDIAHSLSLQCRYNGHVGQFYSVAEHCIHMSYAVPEEDALWALLHDATETYVGDLIRPVKKHLPKFIQIEDVIMKAIVDKFEIGSYEIPASVKEADNRIIENERAALLGPEPLPWTVHGEALLNVEIFGWMPDEAEIRYFARFNELIALRGEKID